MKKKISIYVKGNANTPDYYRIHQYLDKIDNIKCIYHQMLSDCLYDRVIPISAKGRCLQVAVFAIIYLRMTWALLQDVFMRPSYIVILRRITPRMMPFPIKPLLLLNIKLGSKMIWDFDDDILAFKEIKPKDFETFSHLATNISVTHEGLKHLINDKYWNKVKILPTTDGDTQAFYPNETCAQERRRSIQSKVNLVWVATSLNLIFLNDIIQQLDQAAAVLEEKTNRELHLKVVCNEPLRYQAQHLIIENITWTRAEAISELLHSHIGIMPLIDSKIARGKGGFKLVQYLAFGLPCIGTDIGFNNHVIDESCGVLIDKSNKQEWLDAIIKLSDPVMWEGYSKNAYHKWQKDFPFNKNLSYWTQILK